MTPKSDIGVRHSEYSMGDNIFAELIIKDRRFTEYAKWETNETRYEGPGDPVYRRRWEHSENVILSLDGGFINISLGHGEIVITTAAESLEAASRLVALVKDHVPQTSIEGTTRPISFWSDSPNGPRRVVRVIDVPTWHEIAANYPIDIAQELERSVGFKPSSAGQLLLWRGEPGTGKTWALRALIREWEWARFHYITDPDSFFGQNASYMLQVLLEDEPDGPPPDSDELGIWRVLLLEDAGEMLSRDARERSGQGLSRLLNLVDGLIGQGLRVLVLITTNEELGSLHPAIARPGRCAVNFEFRALSPEEAQGWLKERGSSTRIHSHTTIANLYAMLQGLPIPVPESLGFSYHWKT